MIAFISPAKTFDTSRTKATGFTPSTPTFEKEKNQLVNYLKDFSIDDLTSILNVSNDIGQLNYDRVQNFYKKTHLIPAIYLYYGMQFKSLEYKLLDMDGLNFLNKSLRILSGLYGSVAPFDLIQPYRLEMGTKITLTQDKNLYEFWGNKIYEELKNLGQGVYINLASKEYSKVVEPFIAEDEIFLTCSFKVEKDGKLKTHSVQAKKARGAMARYIAQEKITDYEDLKKFDYLDYKFIEEKVNKKRNKIEYIYVQKTKS